MRPTSTPKLVVKRQDGYYDEISWDGDIVTIGRDAANDIVINHPLASRRHAQFERGDEGFCIRDLDSTNGTFMNDNHQRIELMQMLSNHDKVFVADTVITFQDPEATMKGPIPRELLQAVREEVRVDGQSKDVYIQGNPLDPPLTVKEFQLLELLYNRRGQVISKDEIAKYVWDYEVFDYNAIDALVYRLRQRIEPEPTNPRYLLTQRGFGYKLIVSTENTAL